MNTEQLRKEFEAWAVKNHYTNFDKFNTPRQGYVDVEVYSASEAYLAAAESRDDVINELIAECRYYKDMLTGLELGRITHPVRPYSKSNIPTKTAGDQSRDELIGKLRPYIKHHDKCHKNSIYVAIKQCTCGLDTIIAEAKAQGYGE